MGVKPGRPADGADGFVRCAVACLHLARKRCEEALAAHDVSTRLEFPGSIYHLPIIYGVTGRPIRMLADVAWVLEEAEQRINSKSAAQLRISHSSAALDVGMAVLWLAEVIEALKYLGVGPAPVDDIWLGAAADGIMRARGIEFIEESTPGFAAVIGEAPSVETAVALAHEMQQKSLYVFMAGEGGECLATGDGFDRLPTIGAGGTTLAEQLIEGGVQLGWDTRLVPFGREAFAHVHSIGFAVRVAMAFGGVEPGDCRTLFAYVEDRVPAFVVLLGPVTDLQCVVAAGAMNFGLPAIATHDIPTTLPSTDCTRWRVVPRVPPHDLVARSIEVRGLKTVVGEMDIPVAYGHVFSGERIRNDDLHLEMGSPKAPGCELLLTAEDVEDGRVTVVGPEVEDLSFGSTVPLGVLVEVAGRRMQKDFEPILERQLHHLLNEVQGLRHMGQRDVLGMHLSHRAVEAGFRFEHLGRIIHSIMHAEYSQIVDRVQVTVFTQTEMVLTLLERAQAVYRERDERIGSLTDEDVDEFYSCTICQSFAPNHVCIMTPERCGLCGAYSWLDGKISFQINPAGPSRPIRKDNVLDAARGSWEGINSFVHDASHGAVERIDLYSLLEYPMTSCGCFECISGVLPLCNGIFTVDRDYSGMIPIGVKLSTLADMVRGGAQTPGFLAHSRLYVGSPRFLSGDGGILRLVWMPRYLKESLRAEIEAAAVAVGHPDLWEKIATEDDAVEEEEVMSFLARVGHPALDMEAMF
ncbi:MAG: CO dehydrogenase/CO-methylating acetyl-CoA synthase complex subunit beta [Actinobacteria bacterium]|nr:CO dehydrogenase/CO-methylating acetyl-CoA synthase complex subunit beta [Actinomycetota bacterium]